MNDIINWALNSVSSVDPVLRTVVAGIGIFFETTLLLGLIVPGDTIVLVASTGVRTPVEYVALVITVVVFALGGESIGYALGTFFGPRIQGSRLGRRIGEDNWRRANNYLDRRGGIAVFLSRFLPVFHSLVPVTVGMSTMRYRKFMAFTAPACLLWALLYVSVGTFAAGSYRALDKNLTIAGYVFAGIIVAFLVGAFLVRRGLSRSEARHMNQPGDGDANTIDDPPR